ncbi:hypothetical protein B0J11DRAFT_576722 [Dendryphion nanum]|uniref:Uncharacterized protein n=1 Tax=Dendryphion nanum TaxID=256645 RepID=A0A9P9EEI8_9PLEO|nr:hypothetical protein B0J11DRAFT_576722 [Dendryphion nanum]
MKTTIITSLLSITALTTAATIPQGNPQEEPGLIKRDPCTINAIWESNWRDGARQRYRVRATVDTTGNPYSRKDMLEAWCDEFRKAVHSVDYKANFDNPACWLENTNAVADVSTFIGSYGHDRYVGVHQDTVNAWRDRTGYVCDVNSNF